MQDGPVLLVGHSWGGAIITEGGNHHQVKGLVYIVAPHVERDTADRMGAEALVLKSSHVPMLSQPEAVAELIAKAAATIEV